MKANSKLASWLLFIALGLIWGSSFILMKRGLESFTALQVAACRIFCAFLFVLPFTYKYFDKGLLTHWKAIVVMGVMGNLIPAFMFTIAETHISSSLTGMLNSLTPLFTILIGVLLFKAKIKAIKVLGVVIGFIGAVGLLYFAGSGNLSDNIGYSIYVVIATICYALSINVIRKYLAGVNSISATVMAICFIGPLSGIYLFSTDFLSRIKTNPDPALTNLGYIFILGMLGTGFAVMLFNLLIKNTSALFASSVTYLIPVIAIMWGIFDGEHIGINSYMCIGVILCGVYIVNKKD